MFWKIAVLIDTTFYTKPHFFVSRKINFSFFKNALFFFKMGFMLVKHSNDFIYLSYGQAMETPTFFEHFWVPVFVAYRIQMFKILILISNVKFRFNFQFHFLWVSREVWNEKSKVE